MVRQASFQVGDPAYLGENRIKVLGRFRIVGSEQQRVWVACCPDGHTVACDEADLQDIGAWSLARLQISREPERSKKPERSWKIRTAGGAENADL